MSDTKATRSSRQVLLEGAELLPPPFRNFAGKEGPYNREGERSFCVLLPEELAEQLAKDGWNIKTLEPRDDDEGAVERPYLNVAVKYETQPPTIVSITSNRSTAITERTVETLDYMQFLNVDVLINPYEWAVNGKTGIKAYLKSMYVTVEEDALQQKYADLEVNGNLED